MPALPQVMHFFGVGTAGSLSMRLFPRWIAAMGADAVLEGVDLPLRASDEHYRQAVVQLKEDPMVRGALVTSHKINVVRAAGDLIDRLTPEAQLCGEVSALYKRGDALWGHACDPTNCGRAMEHFLGTDYWRRHPRAEILAFGAGGATVAMLVHLVIQARSRPERIRLVDIRKESLDHCQRVLDQLCVAGLRVDLVHSADSHGNDGLVKDLPPHSLVINATGMGKDLPGSPVTDAVRFPEGGAVWELNYRGQRCFLGQARKEKEPRGLIVEDGWHYFLHGWSSVMSLVFDTPMTPALFEKFAAVSEEAR